MALEELCGAQSCPERATTTMMPAAVTGNMAAEIAGGGFTRALRASAAACAGTGTGGAGCAGIRRARVAGGAFGAAEIAEVTEGPTARPTTEIPAAVLVGPPTPRNNPNFFKYYKYFLSN